MNFNEWANLTYDSLKDASKKISQNSELHEELLHYSLEQLAFKVNLQEIIDSGGANFYVIRIMMNSWKSTTSPFYNIYRKPSVNLDEVSYLTQIADDSSVEEEEYIMELSRKIKGELNALHWYENKLFSLYLEEDHTLSSLSRSTGIPRTSISLTINRIKSHIKSQITN